MCGDYSLTVFTSNGFVWFSEHLTTGLAQSLPPPSMYDTVFIG